MFTWNLFLERTNSFSDEIENVGVYSLFCKHNKMHIVLIKRHNILS